MKSAEAASERMNSARVRCFFSAAKIVLMVGKIGMLIPFPFWDGLNVERRR